MKRILVCGGRDYGRVIPGKTFEYPRRIGEKKRGCEVLGKLLVEHGAFVLIHGDAEGADKMAADWAAGQRGFPRPLAFPALWYDLDVPGAVIKRNRRGQLYNVIAGPQRNQRMLDEGKPDLIVAFPGGTGTKDMVDRGRRAGIPIQEVK